MKIRILALAAIGVAASVAVLSGQSGRSYGPGHTWWDAGQGGILPWQEEYDDPSGLLGIVNTKGLVHTDGHPFFAPIGENGRACVTCHQPSNAMSISADAVQKRWTETEGKDVLFAAIDGSNCPDLPQAQASSHSLLLNRGLFRIALPWPPNNTEPEFTIEVVRDPTGCNKSPVYGLTSPNPSINVYRRPRIAANLRHVVSGPGGMAIMADSREPSLRTQAISAALTHEEAKTRPTEEQLRQIIDFESQIYVAQYANVRGGLTEEVGGPRLGRESLSAAETGLPEPGSFDVWKGPSPKQDLQLEFRASVARGSDLFYKHSFKSSSGVETCASCHKAGTTRWRDAGTSNVASAAEASPDLPLFKVTCKSTGKVSYTQDPGRGLISGKCADVGAIVVPQFRGMAARSPYFTNGSARTLSDVVEFYDKRFGIGYTAQQKQDLANFLSVL
jgi:cytochrome c553